MLRALGVRKTFVSSAPAPGGVTVAVDGVDLEVAAGETVALIGPSGCGKSTLLRLLAALLEADAGRIELGDLILLPRSERPADRGWRRRLGYVIQDGGLFPHRTARGNLTLQPSHFGWDPARIEARIAELAELVHLEEDVLERFPAQLSGGQRQRVGLMRALMMDPDVLLLDEPLGALDPMIRADLQRDLRDIFRALAKTVVLVTHDLAEARFLGDRIVLLQDGRVVQDGSYEDLVAAPANDFVVRFLTAQGALHGDAARKGDRS